MSNNSSSSLEVTLSFLLGTATGFILGVIFAPASGQETRKNIQDHAKKTGDKAKTGYEKIAKEAEKGIQSIKEKTTEGIDAVKEFVDKKKEELTSKHEDKSEKTEKKDKEVF